MRRWQILMIVLLEAAGFLLVIDHLVGTPWTLYQAGAALCVVAASLLPLPATRHGGEGQ